MIRSLLAALLLSSPLSAQIISVKTSVPVFTGAPGIISFQAPAFSPVLSAPALGTGLTPSLAVAPAPALIPVLAAPVIPLAVQPPAAVPVEGAKAIAPLRSAVQKFGDGLRAIPSALRGLFDGSAAVGEPVGPVASVGVPVRTLESIKQLKIGSYNVLNLFENVGKHIPDPENPGKLKKVSEAKPKEEWSLREQGKIILENGLDIVTLAEVENIAALRDFNERFLAGKYNVYLIEGNDERGIDIAFLVKKDLPFIVEQRSHKDEMWRDPISGGAEKTLFSRDLTSLVVRAAGRPEPLFVLFGTHYKSKRDRAAGDPESNILRAAQVQRSAEIVARYRKEFGADTPILFAGDFNGEVGKEEAFRPLFEAAGLTDSFDAAPNPPSDKDRITHTYHPKGGATRYGQMDAVLVSKGLRGAVQSATVYRYKNPDGTERPIPATYEERQKNPSDHFPVIVTLDFAPIRDGASPKLTGWTHASADAALPPGGETVLALGPYRMTLSRYSAPWTEDSRHAVGLAFTDLGRRLGRMAWRDLRELAVWVPHLALKALTLGRYDLIGRLNAKLAAKLARQFFAEPGSVIGHAIASAVPKQWTAFDCAVRSIYNLPQARALRERMSYAAFLKLARGFGVGEEKGADDRAKTALLREAGLEVIVSRPSHPHGPHFTDDRAFREALAAHGPLLGSLSLMGDYGFSFHSFIILDAFKSQGEWRYLTADPGFALLQTWSLAGMSEYNFGYDALRPTERP